MSTYAELEGAPKARNLENALEQALKEAVDDDTYRKVKRMSYSSNAVGEIADRLFGHSSGTTAPAGQIGNPMATGGSGSPKTTADLKLLEKLVTSLLEAHGNGTDGSGQGGRTEGLHRSGSGVLGRFRPMSRSFRSPGSLRRRQAGSNQSTSGDGNGTVTGTGETGSQAGGTMPTIQETGTDRTGSDRARHNSWSDRAGRDVRRVLNSIANAPHRFSHSLASGSNAGGDGPLLGGDEEGANLTQNVL